MERIILVFSGKGCGNCKAFEPILKQLESEHHDVTFIKLDSADNQQETEKYGIVSLPTLVFLKDGIDVEKIVGLKPKTFVAKRIAEIFGD